MRTTLLAATLLSISLTACAQPAAPAAAQSAGTAGHSPTTAPVVPGEAAVRQALTNALPNVTIDRLRPAPITGFTEAVLAGRVFYVSNDGHYVMDGILVDMQTRTNLNEVAMSGLRREALAAVPASQRIVFAAREPKYTVTVFTDIDCQYCRVLHSHMAEYNALGINVEYLFFPRAGRGSGSWDKAVSVWCATDPRKALTDAKAGAVLPKADCENPVENDFALGQRIGVGGTPALYAPNGEHLGGYLEPQKLLEALQAQAPAAVAAPARSAP